ncbi:MAG: PAS domain-containing protein [Deltaproteobacteria bacterium]|nr:PAS domain-containing protein [Deltaproteobacteria bacterium]
MDDSDTPASLSSEERYFKALFDAVPSAVFIVDDDVRILDYNAAGSGILGTDRSAIYMMRGGEALHCLHANDSPEGCGRAEHCRDCVIRTSVGKVLRGGKTVRAKAKMELRAKGETEVAQVDILVIAAPFPYNGKPLVLLVLDDVTELTLLREIVPICSHCKKIRNERGYWEAVEGYLQKHSDLYFSHGICDDCLKRHYGDFLPPDKNR